jgi:hypothetical protein
MHFIQLKSVRGAWDRNVQEVALLALVLHVCVVELQFSLFQLHCKTRFWSCADSYWGCFCIAQVFLNIIGNFPSKSLWSQSSLLLLCINLLVCRWICVLYVKQGTESCIFLLALRARLCDWCGTWKGKILCNHCSEAIYCSRKHQVPNRFSPYLFSITLFISPTWILKYLFFLGGGGWESLWNAIQELHFRTSHQNDCCQIPCSPDASTLPDAGKGCCLFQCYLGLCLNAHVIYCLLDYLQNFLATHGLNMWWIMNLSLHVWLVLSRIIQNWWW